MIKIVKQLEKLDIPVVPLETEKVETCLVYNWYQTNIYTYRLELRLIAMTFAEAEELARRTFELINDFGDENKMANISIEQNGGGSLKDYENNTIQRLLYFDVIKK